MSDFFLSAGVLFTSYVLVTVNIRAIAHKRYAFAGITDAIIPLLQFLLIAQVSEAASWETASGMACGGALSSFVGIWLTRKWGDDDA